jgi:proline dehydrogenase
MVEATSMEMLAAEALRRVAKDQQIKAYIESDAVLFPVLQRAAKRYLGGTCRAECLKKVRAINAAGHAAAIDYMGEGTGDTLKAKTETEEFLQLAQDIDRLNLRASIALDLSHIGLDISVEQAYVNALAIAKAAKSIDTEMIISMEGSERTDAILGIYERLSMDFDNVGITVQARLHRTENDILHLLRLPGKIRLVKGAYEEPIETAFPSGSIELAQKYRQYAKQLIASRKRVSIATHDPTIYADLQEFVEEADAKHNSFEFEVLVGLGESQINSMRTQGYSTRVYVVYGTEWYLYVCHRIAEEPKRLYQALVDIVGAECC